MVTGTAAATLTGLMFIVITLLSGIEVHVPTVSAGVSAFNTPTVVHFCAVLLFAAILSAPWQALPQVSLALCLAALGGVLYLVVVIQRVRSVPGYHTPLKDWVWYVALPLSVYIVLVLASAALPAYPAPVLYLIGAAMLALLFTSLHNAWDLVTYLAIDRAHPDT